MKNGKIYCKSIDLRRVDMINFGNLKNKVNVIDFYTGMLDHIFTLDTLRGDLLV